MTSYTYPDINAVMSTEEATNIGILTLAQDVIQRIGFSVSEVDYRQHSISGSLEDAAEVEFKIEEPAGGDKVLTVVPTNSDGVELDRHQVSFEPYGDVWQSWKNRLIDILWEIRDEVLDD